MNKIYTIITILLSLVVIFDDSKSSCAMLELLHMIMAIVCSIAIFSFPNRPYSLYKVFHIFYLFFFCLAPILQYKSNVKMLGTYFSEQNYILTSTYCLIILLVFNVVYICSTYFVSNKLVLESRYLQRPGKCELSKSKTIFMMIVSIGISVYFLWFNNFNLVSLFVRGGELVNRQEIGSSAQLIISFFLRPMPMIFFLGATIMKVRSNFILVVLFLSVIITAPPTGMARLAVAAMYIPIVLWLVPALRKKNVFAFVMVFGLLVIFPLLSGFRYYNGDSKLAVSLNFDQFLDMNFDAYSMFMRVLVNDIVTNGHQLLGVLLFWVPRSIWLDKPVGSGFYVAETTGLSFNNISMPYFGEGYINFGMIGVLIFTFLIAWFLAKTDFIYWHRISREDKSLENIRYFMLLGLLMFVLRGDLLSGCAYTCGFLASFYVVRWIIKSI